jgi:photosystem II stability/assembly factor-like uncharacterized protein
LDVDTGYAVGDYGTILKTVDGGQKWNSLAAGNTKLLYDVEFPVNSTTGYVSGESGRLAKTTDGGKTWSPIGSFNKDIMAICFPTDNLIGYVATAYQRIYKTTDGGITWNIKHDGNSSQASIADILFPFDTQTGYALSSFGGQSNSKILKTTDGGDSWIITDAGTTSTLSEMSFPTPQVGYISADGPNGAKPAHFLKTTDGGLKWNIVDVPYGYSLTSVCFPKGVDTGYVVGNMSGAILKTINGGGIVTSVSDTHVGNQFPGNTLIQNYPNPFAETTTIDFILEAPSQVVLEIFSFSGEKICQLANEQKSPGKYSFPFNAKDLPSGIYYYRLQTKSGTFTRKMSLMR